MISLDDVKLAYLKLKSSIYYDTSNTNIFLRLQLARFERGIELDGEMDDEFYKLLSVLQGEEDVTYIDRLLNNISLNILPKSFENIDDQQPNNFISNERIAKDYRIRKYSYFINAPIQLHIISVLWLMKIGYSLDKDLDNSCLGNRLILDEETKEIPNGLGLYKPYVKQYQQWRDKGVNVAQDFLKEGQNVLLLNLDIKEFYHSVRIQLNTLDNHLGDIYEDNRQLHNLFKSIHIQYSKQLVKSGATSQNNYPLEGDVIALPIGLLSSSVLANWYLHELDINIKKVKGIAYYARYVDDIFIVIGNPKRPKKDLKKDDLIADYIRLNLDNILTPNSSIPKNPKSKEQIQYKLNGYTNLFIQDEKILLYYFDKDSSSTVIGKMKKEIKEKSSEFRFLGEEERDFDSYAYELVYDDSLGKIRTLKDYKESRYGLSSYFAKKIVEVLKTRTVSNAKDSDQLIAFFKGINILEHYRLWEKLFTYLMITNEKEKYLQLFKQVIEAITRITKAELNDGVNIRTSLVEYLEISLSIGISLNPQFIDGSLETKIHNVIETSSEEHGFYFWKNKGQFPSNINVNSIRSANMMRHNYVVEPLINYTTYSSRSENSLLVTFQEMISSIGSDSSDFDYDYTEDEQKLELSPRNVKLHEISQFIFKKELSEWYFNKLENRTDQWDESQFNYEQLNTTYGNFNRHIKKENNIFQQIKYSTVRKENNDKNIPSIIDVEISNTLKQNTYRVAVANIRVSETNIINALRNIPTANNDRYNEFYNLFDMAENEKTKVDIFVMPENVAPLDYLFDFAYYCAKHQRAMVFGLEHIVMRGYAFNFVITILPINHNGWMDAIVIPRLKNHYAPKENEIIEGYRMNAAVPTNPVYHLFRWKGLYFTVFYCYELADIVHRSLFRSKIDLLIASEWNKDVNYFSNIVESTTRDIHCYFVQSNTSQYGDSRITQPAKTELKNILQLSGGENSTILIGELDVEELRHFQSTLYNLQQDHDTLKPTPPDFNHENADNRRKGENVE